MGASHAGVVTNQVFRFYNKDGTPATAVATFASWFANVAPPGTPFDPRIIYDPHAGRWLVLLLSRNAATQVSSFLLAISQTNDPAGAWWNYKLNGANTINALVTLGGFFRHRL